jgi:hypothetical protein
VFVLGFVLLCDSVACGVRDWTEIVVLFATMTDDLTIVWVCGRCVAHVKVYISSLWLMSYNSI